MDIEKEAEEYAKRRVDLDPIYANGLYYGFVAGANSEWVQSEKIKAQIEVLLLIQIRLSIEGVGKIDDTMAFTINELGRQLKELEDGRNG